MQQSFSFSLSQLGPALSYILQYMSLPLTYELPSASTNPNQEQILQNNYEEFLGFQTHNREQSKYMKAIGHQI